MALLISPYCSFLGGPWYASRVGSSRLPAVHALGLFIAHSAVYRAMGSALTHSLLQLADFRRRFLFVLALSLSLLSATEDDIKKKC